MSERNRKRKESNRAYRAAGAIYWTKDMEKMIRKIRRDRTIWMVGCLLALVVDIVLMMAKVI